ncbi:hypothetical protein KR032_009438 [Drosophila birchii]|nr:hypothetical protein KR032_009438 [Drosophila birchii]
MLVSQHTSSPQSKYTVRVVEDILKEIFMERRGDFPETSSSCHVAEMPWPRQPEQEAHVDKRLRYWKEMLSQRRKVQERVQRETGKLASEVLFNRRSTLDNRDEQTVKRVMDYADRMDYERLQEASVAPVVKLPDRLNPCTCQVVAGPELTAPHPEKVGYKEMEIIGLPEVCQEELLGKEALEQKPPTGWLQSEFLDERLEQSFGAIEKVVEFFPDLAALEVTGTGVGKQKPKLGPTVLLESDSLRTVTNTESPFCSEEFVSESVSGTEEQSAEGELPAPIPEVGLRVNGVDYVPGATGGVTGCYEIVTRFSCDPFRRRIKRVLELTNIGIQTLSFSWKQSTYFYNRASLLLARDNEFYFDLDGFRLMQGESRTVVVLYQPRKVAMAMELWLLQVEPRIFCAQSLLVRLHGRCTPPSDYMAKLLECQCACICKSDAVAMDKLTSHLGALAPLVVPPPACCPYTRDLDDRELFNALNPGYYCARFDDLEVLRALHNRLKKPRECPWNLRLSTIRSNILRVEALHEREQFFAEFTDLLAPLMLASPSVDTSAGREGQKQRSRFIYVRGVICNGITEWEELMFNVEDSFFKPELQRFYQSLQAISDQEDEEDDEEGTRREPRQPRPIDKERLMDILEEEELDDDKIRVAVMRKLYRSKYFRDSLYIQTYSHLCNMAENIVSVIESTEVEQA